MSDELQRSLGKIEAKVDILLERSSSQDKRISAVEKKVWWSTGVGAVLAFIGSNLLGKHT